MSYHVDKNYTVRSFPSNISNVGQGRFDYFPRSVLEIWSEMEKHKNFDIMIEQHTLLHYPTAYYFYVSYQNHELFNDIKQGLEMAIKDGSFDTLYYKHFGEVINKVRQTPRKIYELSNPQLSSNIPLQRKELWLNLNVKPSN
jgi:hypothetical protein